MNRQRWLIPFAALGTVWGLSFFFVEIALQSLTPVGVAFARLFLGALTLVLWGRVTNNPLVLERKLWVHFAVVAMFLNTFPGLMFALGQEYISSSLAGVLNATTPIFSLLFVTFVFRTERLTTGQILGLIMGFFGVAMLLGAGASIGTFGIGGVALVLLATLGYGFAFPYAKKYLSSDRYSASSMAATQLVFALLLSSPAALFFPLSTGPLSLDVLLALFGLGVLGTGFAYIWNFRVIQLVGSTIASTVTYITPLVATSAGVLLLGESLKGVQLIGGLIVLLSAALVQKRLRWGSKFIQT